MKNKGKPRVSLMVRITFLFILTFVITTTVALLNSKRYFQRMAALETRDAFLAGAGEVMKLIDTDTIEASLAEDATLRQTLREQFGDICLKTDMDYLILYTATMDGTKHYLISAGSSAEKDERANIKRGYGAVITSPLRNDQIQCLTGKSEAEMSFLTGDYNCVWTTPVFDSQGNVWGFISAIYSIEHIVQMMNYYRAFILATIGIFVGVSILLALILLRVVVLNRIIDLANYIKLFSAKKHMDYTPEKHFYSDEITDIEESFGAMVSDISEYVDNIQKLTAEKVMTQAQLDIARRIQEGVVPKNYGLNEKSFDVFGKAIPATEVCGDFYDIFFINDDELCVVNGDVSGKGISAALFMMIVKCALKEKLKAGLSLKEAMNQTNKDACVSNSECMFATVFAGILNINTGVLKYANAGHNPPFILGDDLHMLNVDSGIAIGSFDDIDILEDEFTLKPGEGIFVYTDGISEALNRDEEMFGYDRIRKALEQVQESTGIVSAKAFCDKIIESTSQFSAGTSQFDDITCLTLIYR